MKVNDTRHIKQVVKRDELKTGEVYIDEDEAFVLRTDSRSVVDLSNGYVYDLEETYNDSSEFIPVNAVLEIRS